MKCALSRLGFNYKTNFPTGFYYCDRFTAVTALQIEKISAFGIFKMISNFSNKFMRQRFIFKQKFFKFKKSYDLPLDLLQNRRENSAEYLYS